MKRRRLPDERQSITQECRNCGKRLGTDIKMIRHRMRKGTFTGLCPACKREALVGPRSSHWKGGKFKTSEGYIRLRRQEKHLTGGRYVFEHRAVMEQQLGRPLLPFPQETVHHLNGIKDDNRPENLVVRVGSHGPGHKGKHCPTCSCFD